MNDIAEQKKWLRATTHGLLTRFSRWRRRVKIGLVIGGGFIAGAAGVAANLLDPALKWQVYIFQIIGLALVFAGGVLMDFLDEGAADAIKRANELVDAAEERDEIISSLGEDFEWFTRLYATAAALRDVVEGVAASGPGMEDDQKHRFAAMLDVVVADKAILFGMNSDRWNFAIYLYEFRNGVSDLHRLPTPHPSRRRGAPPFMEARRRAYRHRISDAA